MQPTERAIFLDPADVLYEIFFRSCYDKEHDLYLCIELAAAARRRCQVLDFIRPHQVIAACQARVVPPTHCVEVSKIFRGNYYNSQRR